MVTTEQETEQLQKETLTDANNGDGFAMMKMAAFNIRGYFNGTPNTQEALKWWKKAADAGEINGLLCLAEHWYTPPLKTLA